MCLGQSDLAVYCWDSLVIKDGNHRVTMLGFSMINISS